ncbi:MAG: hypothetical protein BWX51_02074 [Bacteroidetes bacterium ADurb.Bin012]|nr:MAG: hypothetical protein BWX51_02074 [Bacteroidetes bacterium ADurb.Bin012]
MGAMRQQPTITMKSNEQINTVSSTRYLVIMHGDNIATFVNTPITSSKMDIYHQLRNFRVKAGKVGQVVLHEFYDIPQECYPSVKTAYESRLWTIDEKDGKNWDKLYKDLLLELDKEKTQKESKEKPNKEKAAAQPPIDPIEALGNMENPTAPENIIPNGDINDPEEPEMATIPVEETNPEAPTTKPKEAKKDSKKGK